LYSALFNLIGNAIKYRSVKKPEILIQIDQSALETKIKISDNGIGIDLVKHGDDLFKPYKRFATEIEGKGLGLFLVKSHVEALHGTITVESNIGVGTSFIITFPAN
jgi:signal transduction histidine kinase